MAAVVVGPVDEVQRVVLALPTGAGFIGAAPASQGGGCTPPRLGTVVDGIEVPVGREDDAARIAEPRCVHRHQTRGLPSLVPSVGPAEGIPGIRIPGASG